MSDLADAHLAAIDWLAGGNASEAFNLGNGQGFSVREVVRTCQQVTGVSINTELDPRRPGDPPVLISDWTKARQKLGWAPKFRRLDQQVDHAWQWFRDEMPKFNFHPNQTAFAQTDVGGC